mmetsp:Transcript_15711/g.50077  ORF Transcript_15711/g.50077 Transcript_15711/m.50077 type:complete len:115 (+) Transcript_15711:1714-2058(+)
MISRAKVATVQLGKVIRMSERVVKPSQEIKVKELLSEVEKEIRDWPGMLSAETLVDTADPHRFVVVTEWESRKHLQHWLKSDLCKDTVAKLDKELDKPVAYRELMHHEDDVFLL